MNINILTIDDLVGIAENLDWAIRIYDAENGLDVEFQRHSPAGEDFNFSVRAAKDDGIVTLKVLEEICEAVSAYSADFDTEEHVTTLLNAKSHGFQGVPSVKELVEDADAIEQLLRELSESLIYGRLEEKQIYEVTIGRTGVVFVSASSEADAMELADHLKTDEISWSDDWSPTDVAGADGCDGAVYSEPSF